MTKEQLNKFVPVILKEIETILKNKNNDYTARSDSAFANFEQASEYGVDPLVGLCVRMGDKHKRVQTFCKNGHLAVKSERVEDAFIDMIGYCILALAMLEDRDDEPKTKDDGDPVNPVSPGLYFDDVVWS